jgi:hypothetical protein
LQAGQNWNELLQSDHLVEGSVQFTNGFGQFLLPVLPRVDFFLQLQRRFNPREQLHFLERFLDVIRCARVERDPQDLLWAAGGHHDDRDIAQGLHRLDATARLHSVDLRHPHVHHDQVDLFRSSAGMFQVKVFERVMAEEAESVSRYPASLSTLWRSNRASGESSTRRIFMRPLLGRAGQCRTVHPPTQEATAACPPQ